MNEYLVYETETITKTYRVFSESEDDARLEYDITGELKSEEVYSREIDVEEV